MRVKVVAFYLPQYYTFKENDEWWGKGFTEWTNVKKARKLFSWQKQPQLPLDDDYYELNNNHHETMAKQIDMAKKYGVYGFCFYHYWFKNGKKLLEVPLEKFLADKSLDIHFCLSWANEPWTRTWDGGNKKVIMPQEYGDEYEWTRHFYYLLPFFKDERYIKVGDKPLLVIYRPELIGHLEEMLGLWSSLAVKERLTGIEYIAQGSLYSTARKRKHSGMMSKCIMYEPGYTQGTFSVRRSNLVRMFLSDPRLFMNILGQKIKVVVGKKLFPSHAWWNTTILNYDLFWRNILRRDYRDGNYIPGAFVDWDNTARRGSHGARIFKGGGPEKFQRYFGMLADKVVSESDCDMIFITAWNEWGEGAHLEPDQNDGFKYLEGICRAVKNG